jgi:putative membrane protein
MIYVAAAILALGLAAPASNIAYAAELNSQETQFLQKAAVAGTFEMQASQMALQSADQERVKQFARLMLVQHEQIDAALKRVARDRSIVLPVALDGDRQAALADLQQAKGADFDKRYIQHVAVGGHEQAIELFGRAAKESEDREVKAFATETVGLLQQHLDKAKMIAEANPPAEKDSGPASQARGLPSGELMPRTTQPTMEGKPGTPEEAAESQ